MKGEFYLYFVHDMDEEPLLISRHSSRYEAVVAAQDYVEHAKTVKNIDIMLADFMIAKRIALRPIKL